MICHTPAVPRSAMPPQCPMICHAPAVSNDLPCPCSVPRRAMPLQCLTACSLAVSTCCVPSSTPGCPCPECASLLTAIVCDLVTGPCEGAQGPGEADGSTNDVAGTCQHQAAGPCIPHRPRTPLFAQLLHIAAQCSSTHHAPCDLHIMSVC